MGRLSAIGTPNAPAWNQAYIDRMLALNFYRIFFPLPEDIQLLNGTSNPWQAAVCTYPQ